MNERSKGQKEAFYELPPQPEGWEAHLEKAVEGQSGADSPSIKKAADNSAPVPDAPAAGTPDPAASSADDTSVRDNSGQYSDEEENEVIEKQWVEKAKSVIYQHKDSPYQQRKEFGKVKAAYMKARFNKILKVEEAG